MRSALVHGIGESAPIVAGIVLPTSPAENGGGYSRCKMAVRICFNGGRVRKDCTIGGHICWYLRHHNGVSISPIVVK